MGDSSPTMSTNPSSGGSNKCAFIGCENTKAKFPALRFFKFPVSRKDVCDVWIANCANDVIVSLPSKTLSHRLVCEKHFTQDCFINDKKNRLKAFAIPRSELQLEEFYRSQPVLAKKKAISNRVVGTSDCMLPGNNAQGKKHVCLVSPCPEDSSRPSSGNKCSFNGCSNSKSKFPSLHFFKFPVLRKCVCDTWILNCANDVLVSLPSKTLRHRVICEKHFTRQCFTSDMKVRLTEFAVPTPASQDDECDQTQDLTKIETLKQEVSDSGSTLAGDMVQGMKHCSFLFRSPTTSMKLQGNVTSPFYTNYTRVKGTGSSMMESDSTSECLLDNVDKDKQSQEAATDAPASSTLHSHEDKSADSESFEAEKSGSNVEQLIEEKFQEVKVKSTDNDATDIEKESDNKSKSGFQLPKSDVNEPSSTVDMESSSDVNNKLSSKLDSTEDLAVDMKHFVSDNNDSEITIDSIEDETQTEHSSLETSNAVLSTSSKPNLVEGTAVDDKQKTTEKNEPDSLSKEEELSSMDVVGSEENSNISGTSLSNTVTSPQHKESVIEVQTDCSSTSKTESPRTCCRNEEFTDNGIKKVEKNLLDIEITRDIACYPENICPKDKKRLDDDKYTEIDPVVGINKVEEKIGNLISIEDDKVDQINIKIATPIKKVEEIMGTLNSSGDDKVEKIETKSTLVKIKEDFQKDKTKPVEIRNENLPQLKLLDKIECEVTHLDSSKSYTPVESTSKMDRPEKDVSDKNNKGDLITNSKIIRPCGLKSNEDLQTSNQELLDTGKL